MSRTLMSRRVRATLAVALSIALPLAGLPPVPVLAQDVVGEAAAPAEPPSWTAEQIEQLVAPIALYPDALLMQVLMAATYPLEVVEADRWLEANRQLSAERLDEALESKSWDPSVQSLTKFPDLLRRMSEQLDWTKDLGDAFLAQQGDVMNAVQVMRARAQQRGNLQTNAQQNVIVEQAPARAASVTVVQAPPQVIRIEPAQPQVVYVPSYSPTVVYGPPPPTVYYPYFYSPAYYSPAATAVISFGIGLAVGAALWGGCDWNNHHVYGYRGPYYGHGHGPYSRGHDNGNVNVNINHYDRPNWKHDPRHRGSVPYRSREVQERYRASSRPATRPSTRPAGIDGTRNPSSTPRPGRPGEPTRPTGRPDGATRPEGRPGKPGGQDPGSRPASGNRPAARPSGEMRPSGQPSLQDRPNGAAPGTGGGRPSGVTKDVARERPASDKAGKPAPQARPSSPPSKDKASRSPGAVSRPNGSNGAGPRGPSMAGPSGGGGSRRSGDNDRSGGNKGRSGNGGGKGGRDGDSKANGNGAGR